MYEVGFMSDDEELKLTLQKVVSNAVQRMELASEPMTKKCIFQEYKEWLGSSIDDWVLSLPTDWRKTDGNSY